MTFFGRGRKKNHSGTEDRPGGGEEGRYSLERENKGGEKYIYSH